MSVREDIKIMGASALMFKISYMRRYHGMRLGCMRILKLFNLDA